MIANLIETKSRITKNVTATSGNYHLNATAVIEDGSIVNLSGSVSDASAINGIESITFDAYRSNGELKVNYHNIAADERAALDIISAMVDAIVAKYQA